MFFCYFPSFIFHSYFQSNDSSETVASRLTSLTSITDSLQTIDVGYVADVLDSIKGSSEDIDREVCVFSIYVEQVFGDGGKGILNRTFLQVLSDVISSVSHVLSLNQSSLSRSQNLLNTSMRFVQSLDDILDKAELNTTTPNISVVSENIAIEVWKVSDDDDNPVLGIADLTSEYGKL